MAAATPATASGARFSGMRRAANTTTGSAGHGARRERPGVLALEHRHLAAQPLIAQPSGVQPREAERLLGHARAAPLDRVADPRRSARGTRASTRRSTPRASRRRSRNARTAAQAAASSEKYGNDAVWTLS